MKIIPALSVPFYEFQCDETLLDEIYLLVQSMKFDTTEDGSAELSKDYFYHDKLISWFENCLEEVRKLYFIDEIKLSVTTCWATRTSFIHKHHIHTHQQSLVGGILYLEDSNSGETVFYHNNPWHKYHHDNIMNILDETKLSSTQIITKISPSKGKLILYPPHLVHGTNLNKNKKYRYSIAFDAYMSGKITKNSKWPYVEIKTTSLKEIYNGNQ